MAGMGRDVPGMNVWRIGWAAACGWALTAGADVVVVEKVEQSGKPPQTTQITLKLKGEKIRADIGRELSVIMDTASGTTVTLRHAQKTALEISGAATRQLMEAADRLRQESGEIGGKPKAEPTGQKETVAGRETRAYAAQTGAVRITWWVAARQPGSDPLADAFETLQKAPMVQLAGGMAGLPGALQVPGVPLKTEMLTPDGRKITTTVLSAKEQPLEAIDFAAPAEYRWLAAPLFGPSLPKSAP